MATLTGPTPFKDEKIAGDDAAGLGRQLGEASAAIRELGEPIGRSLAL